MALSCVAEFEQQVQRALGRRRLENWLVRAALDTVGE
jgi:hypothetical protein